MDDGGYRARIRLRSVYFSFIETHSICGGHGVLPSSSIDVYT